MHPSSYLKVTDWELAYPSGGHKGIVVYPQHTDSTAPSNLIETVRLAQKFTTILGAYPTLIQRAIPGDLHFPNSSVYFVYAAITQWGESFITRHLGHNYRSLDFWEKIQKLVQSDPNRFHPVLDELTIYWNQTTL